MQAVTPEEMQRAAEGEGGKPLSMPVRQVKLEWPESMRIGEVQQIQLDFEPVAGAQANDSGRGYGDIYTQYNLMAEARYEGAGVNVSPGGATRESLPPGSIVRFSWRVSTKEAGSYTGRVWLSLRYLPLDGSEAAQAPIYIQDVRIKITSLLGLDESKAYVIGGLGVATGLVLTYEEVISWVKWLMNKLLRVERNTVQN